MNNSLQNTTQNISLYNYAMSPYGAKVHSLLQFKKLPFKVFYINPFRVKPDLPVGHQIPVVTVNGESKADSTPIGLWLDELFPDHPRLLPDDQTEKEKLLDIDNWVSHRLIPNVFRSYPGEGMNLWINGWKLGHVMNQTCHGGLPSGLRYFWPLVISNVKFVKHMQQMADTHLPVQDAKEVIYQEFIERLDGGPFLGGRATPSFPDIAAYPQFLLFYKIGFRGADDILKHSDIVTWLNRVRPYVEESLPPLLPSVVVNNPFPTLEKKAPFNSSFFPEITQQFI
mgnify:FL=1